MLGQKSFSPRRGFTLLEIIVAMVVIALLVGVVALRSAKVVDRGKVTKVVDSVNTLKQACAMHHFDTSTFAYEYSGYPASSQRLSQRQTYSGWKGPYIEKQLTVADNPFGGTVHLYSIATPNGNPGFDKDGDGTLDVTAAANVLWMSGVPSEQAKDVNDAFDSGIPGTWSDSGVVRYSSATSQLFILVHY